MAGDWKPAVLRDLIEIKHGYAFQGQFFRDDPPGSVLVTPGNFSIGGGFNDRNLRYYEGDVPAEFTLSPNDLIVSMTDLSKGGDTLGYSALVPRDGRRYLHNQRIGKIFVRPNVPLHKNFAYWLLRSPAYRSEVLGSATGSTVRHTSPSRIGSFRFYLPALGEQTVIAELLGALDDKIELNRRRAETLEAMARALFQSWFVDFDPVHAKAEGRLVGLAADVAALFPNSFGEDGLPEGWQSRPLPTLARFLNGLALQKYPAQDGEPSLPVIKIAELRVGPTPKSGRASKNVPAAYHVRDGDHLFSWSGSLTHCRWTHGPGALNQHLFKVSALGEVPDWLIYRAVEHHMPEFQAIASGKAVTMGHIQRHHLDQATVACPPSATLRGMDTIMSPLQNRGLAAALQSRNLAALRDTLLPKLISGELRIADAEERIAAA